jgi:hypothetical protein
MGGLGGKAGGDSLTSGYKGYGHRALAITPL